MTLGKKKIFMSVTASAIVAGGFLAVDEASAETYKVQNGDTLWSIAKKHNLTVTQLKSLNNLSDEIIFSNQTIKVTQSKTDKKETVSSANTTDKVTSQNKSSSNTYTVKPGDSLSKIARLHNVSINNLISWNKLNSTLIYPGNVLITSQNNTNSGQTDKNIVVENNKNEVSYTVKSGDTLSKIANQYKVSVANLKKWNKLNSDIIRVGQKLNVQAESSNESNKNESPSNSSDTQTNVSSSTYTVKSGDTLSAIARSHNVSVNNIKKWNNLTSDVIYIGQKLSMNAENSSVDSSNSTDNTSSPTDVDYNVNQLLSVSNQAMGTKYVWGGQTLNGFDCSGFIHWAYNGAGMKMDRLSTDGYYNRSYYVNNPKVGDLVFFKNTYRSGISHAGIYVGNNQFIHAGTSTGVTISSLDNSYWKKHYDGFKRFY